MGAGKSEICPSIAIFLSCKHDVPDALTLILLLPLPPPRAPLPPYPSPCSQRLRQRAAALPERRHLPQPRALPVPRRLHGRPVREAALRGDRRLRGALGPGGAPARPRGAAAAIAAAAAAATRDRDPDPDRRAARRLGGAAATSRPGSGEAAAARPSIRSRPRTTLRPRATQRPPREARLNEAIFLSRGQRLRVTSGRS